MHAGVQYTALTIKHINELKYNMFYRLQLLSKGRYLIKIANVV